MNMSSCLPRCNAPVMTEEQSTFRADNPTKLTTQSSEAHVFAAMRILQTHTCVHRVFNHTNPNLPECLQHEWKARIIWSGTFTLCPYPLPKYLCCRSTQVSHLKWTSINQSVMHAGMHALTHPLTYLTPSRPASISPTPCIPSVGTRQTAVLYVVSRIRLSIHGSHAAQRSHRNNSKYITS